jgi:hypothetical protein
VQARDIATCFPEPFGLDRHRLRLKAGASEKLKLSFLPFLLPAAPAPTAPAKGPRKASAPAQQQQPAVPPVRSLLVLKDSDCGEFTYELLGDVEQPATFMQHEAKVGVDGVQVRGHRGGASSDGDEACPVQIVLRFGLLCSPCACQQCIGHCCRAQTGVFASKHQV